MKNSRLTNLALGVGLGLAVAFGGGVTSGCATEGGLNEGYVLRKQLQAHGEFHGQSVFGYRNQLIQEMNERRAKGNLPSWVKNVNQFYDWKKQQEPYESDAKAKEDALKTQEFKKSY